MLTIRLTPTGRKNIKSFRLVVTEKSAPLRGRFLEVLGFYNPVSKEKAFKEKRVTYWLEQGAQCSVAVHNLLLDKGIVPGLKKRAHSTKKRKKKKQAPKPVAVKAEPKTEVKEEIAAKKDETKPVEELTK